MNKFLLHITSFVVIILFLFMGACHNHPQAPMLLEVEKIIEEQPDSALSILNKIENINQLSEKDHATYCLLLTQAQDLNYITHTSDSLIKIAATYFEKSNDKQHSMLAYYYLAYIIHSGFISGYQNRYGDNLKPPTNVYHRMTA